jgi:hypothetical protein
MTVFGADLGLVKMPRPVEGYRAIVSDLLELQMPKSAIRKLISSNAAGRL